MILNGGKEIFAYLRCGVRTIQRWEKNALPVDRPIPGAQGHVIAYSEERDRWVRTTSPEWPLPGEFTVSIANAQKLCEQNRALRAELRGRMQALKEVHLRFLRGGDRTDLGER